MGRPNFQRLAELGQLPDYISPTVDQALAQVDAMRREKKEVRVAEEKVEETEERVEDGEVEEKPEEITEEKPKRGRPKKEVEFVDNLN